MLTFLFWNLNGKRLEASVARLAQRHSVDVLMLAECAIAPDVMLQALNELNSPRFELPWTAPKSIVVYTRFDRGYLTPLHDEGNKMTVRKLALPGRTEIILAVVHLASKLRRSGASQSHDCIEKARILRRIEYEHGIDRTVLVGDLNVNPFEEGVVSAAGFNATMAREIASRRSRKVGGSDYSFFYNPMWAHFGDARGAPPGTYFYDGSQHVNYFWNLFDQVLVRPSLMGRFPSDKLKILDSDGTCSFLTKSGRPDQSVASDHLPILFGLDL